MAAAGRDADAPPTWHARLSGLIGNGPFILRLVWSAAPRLLTFNLIARVITALIPVATLWLSKLIVDLVVASANHRAIAAPRIWWLVGAGFSLAAAATISARLTAYCEARLADELSREISLRVMRHATSLDLVSFEDPSFYDILDRARVQAADRIELLGAFGNLVQQVVSLISFAAGVIIFSIPVFLFLTTSLIPAFVAETGFAFLGYSVMRGLTPLKRELDYLRTLGTSKEAAKETQVLGLGRYLVDRFTAKDHDVIQANRTLQLRRLKLGSLYAVVGLLGYYGAYAFVVWRTLAGELTVGTFTFLAGAIAGTSAQLQATSSTFAAIADQSLFLSDLREFLSLTPTIRSVARARPSPRPIRHGFEFRKVSFHYPGSDRLILNELDLHISPTERLALVGANGQGKTTCVKLLAHLYEPTSGHILLDGVDLREYSIDDLHRQIGVVFQDFVHYDLTARENIGLGAVDRLADDGRILAAARNSRAAEVIDRLPGGLEQMLGRRFDGGVELSGGEWQRLALARAYMSDAQLLILDEPTAALDAASESELFERLSALIEGRMAVLISHRLSTVRMCNRIVVLDGGRITEEGSHERLMATDGHYAHLFRLQASQYV
jgi:ATP-binding cassette, subfamily B, bacterial